ncbi:MAG: ATP-binding protein [Bacteroidia bacterium]|nr:ATP-binding protein [Bacteroidia bacterium]
MNHLKKIVFINSAGFEYAHFDLLGNVHFSGKNGTGKSLVLQGINLLFQGKFLSSGTLFNRLFPHNDSLIIGQWQNTERAFTVCVFAASGKLQFLFVSGEYEKEIYCEGNTPRTQPEIQEQIRKRKLDHLLAEQESGEYLSILWGVALSTDHPVVKKFSLAKDTCDPITFLPGLGGKVDFESTFFQSFFRHSLAEGFPQLQPAREILKRFSTAFSDIHAYEHEKHRISRILAFSQEIADYESRLQELFADLFFQKDQLNNQKNEAENEKSRLLFQAEIIQTELKDLERSYKEQEEGLRLLRDKTFAELQIAHEKNSFYRGHPQAKLLDELPFLPAKKRELLNSRRELEILHYPEKKDSNSESENQEQEKKQFAFDIELQRFLLRQGTYDSILNFSSRKLKEKQTLIRTSREISENLENRIRELNQKFFDLHSRIREIKSQGKETNKIQNLHTEIRTLEEKQVLLASESEMIKSSYEVLRLKKIHETETEEKSLKENLQQAENSLQTLQIQIKNIESQIKNRQGTLYHWLEKNYPDWKNTFGKVLKEEVLFHPFLSPEIGRLNDLLFGVKMDLSDLEFTLKSARDLEREKAILEKSAEKQEKEILLIRTDIEKRLSAIEKKYQTKFRQVEKDQKKNQYELELNASKLRQLRQRQDGISHEADKEAHGLSIHLLYEAEELKKQIHSLETERQGIYVNLEITLSQIDQEIEKHTLENNESLSLSLRDLEIREEETYKSLIDRKKLLENETKPSKGENKAVATLKKLIAGQEAKIEQLELAEKTFWRYRTDKNDYLDRIPELEDQVKTYDQKIHSSVLQREKEIHLKKTAFEQLKNAISLLEKNLWEIEEQNRAFENFRLSPIFKTSSFQVSEPRRESESISILIRRIREADYARERAEESLKREIHTFVTCFSHDNLAGFPLTFNSPSDYTRFATQLQHFYENDLIEPLRDQLGAKFAKLIHQLADISNLFEKRLKLLEENVKNLNRILSTLPELATWGKIILRLTPGRHPVMGVFSKIREFAGKFSHQLGELSLFNQTENANANREAIQLLETLNRILRDYPGEEIADCDFAEIDIVPDKTKRDMFSPGQKYLLENILRIAFLRLTAGQFTPGSRRFHLLIDHAEVLDGDAIQQLAAFAHQENIDLITAAPEVPEDINYQRVYLLGVAQPLTMFFSLNNSKVFSNGPKSYPPSSSIF